MSDSLWPHGLQHTRLLCPWNSPGKYTGVLYHFLLQGIFPTQELNPGLPHCRQIMISATREGKRPKGGGNLCLIFLVMSQNVHLISQSQYRSLSHPSYTVSLLTYCITLRESLISVGAIFQNVTLGDFPGGAVFRTLCFHYMGVGLIPGQGTKIPHVTRPGQKKIFFQ